MPRTYVNNSMNRSLGRVGMSVGSMPVSRGSGSGGGSSFGGSSGGYGGFGGSSSSSSSCGTTSKVYADNAYNQRHGRAGQPLGSHVISKSNGSDAKTASTSASADKVYVDNAYNRKHERVGLPLGSSVISKKAVSGTDQVTSTAEDTGIKVYKDNSINRRLKRVGKVVGTAAVYSQKTKTTGEVFYKDNKRNRELGRVGKPRGSMPSKNKSPRTKTIKDIDTKIKTGEEIETDERNGPIFDFDYDDESLDQAILFRNRAEEEAIWKTEEESVEPPKTKISVLQDYMGEKISFSDIRLGKKIGGGGFGEVYFAKWKGAVVAVKNIINETVSRKRLEEFEKEVINFNKLDHPNIVKFIGACVERPNLCIVMEYMQMSLFEAIHVYVDDVDFEERERLDIMRQSSEGLKYLHSKSMAHCDLKTTNVLISIQFGKTEVKLSDFGLSSMKNSIQTSSSCAKLQAFTLRYSAPEILRGQDLPRLEDKMRADIYSLSLIFFEVVFEDEPFYDFNIPQLMKRVGEKFESPEMPEKPTISRNVRNIIEKAWCSEPSKRPTIASICDSLATVDSIYGN